MPKTVDQHLWACALEVERQHGDNAAIHAGFEIDRLTTWKSEGLADDPGAD